MLFSRGYFYMQFCGLIIIIIIITCFFSVKTKEERC